MPKQLQRRVGWSRANTKPQRMRQLRAQRLLDQEIPSQTLETDSVVTHSGHTIQTLLRSNSHVLPRNIVTLQQQFVTELDKLDRIGCRRCGRTELCEKEENFTCSTCRSTKSQNKFTAENDMYPGEVPPQLEGLTQIEQMLITRIQPILKVYRLRASGGPGQYKYSGHVLNVEQDIQPIATVLPQRFADLQVIVIRRETAAGFRDFCVRKQRVIDALYWLKENNPYYNDIVINLDEVNSLPAEDIDVADRLNHAVSHDGTELVELEDDDVVETGVIPLRPVTSTRQVTERIAWPSATGIPINEYRGEGYIAKAFPHLFPYGKASFNNLARPIPLSFKEWVKFLLHYADPRFAQDPRFRYFCLNRDQRHDAAQKCSIFADKRHFTGTLEQLAQRLQQQFSLLNNLLAFNAKIRGTPLYWCQRRFDLEAMINQLGIPTAFLTLSAADLWWPDIQKIFRIDSSSLPNERTIARRMQSKINDNPQIANEYFVKRVAVFLKIIFKQLKVVDHWYRFEWQHRGSPHVHILLWIEGAPDVRTFDTCTPEQLEIHRSFYDRLVSAHNPNRTAAPATKHPSNEICSMIDHSDPTKVSELLNRVQRHTDCRERYCLKRKNGKNVCRFNFPKPLQPVSTLEKDDKGNWTYTPARNDERLDEHNLLVSVIWRANTDCKVVTSSHAMLMYLAKYASKSESRSPDFNLVMHSTLNRLPVDTTARAALTKIINQVINQRDYSACEVHHLLSGLPLYQSSRTFVVLPIGDNNYVEVGETKKSQIEHYIEREGSLEAITLFEFASNYRRYGTRYRRTRKSYIVRVVPYVTEGSAETNELYYKQQVMLRSSFRIIADLKTHDTWRTTFQSIARPTWRLEGEVEVDEYDEPEPAEHNRYQWMEVCAVGPNALPAKVTAGYRDRDRNFDWFASYYTLEGIENNLDHIKRSKETSVLREQVHNEQITLNEEQKKILEHFQLQLQGDTNQKRSIVIGPAGTGKSCVIRQMITVAEAIHGAGSVMLLAPTGVAANNIKGETIHSALRLNVSNLGVVHELNGEARRTFESRMENINVVIIDEFSMIGMRLFSAIDTRLRHGNPEESDSTFANYIIYLFGDQNQLQPVKDRALFKSADASNDKQIHSKQIYNQFDLVFHLTQVMRQVGLEQAAFRECLQHIGQGTVTEEDYSLIKTRFTTTNPSIGFSNAIRIMPTNERINEYNEHKLIETSNPVTIIRAINKPASASEGRTDDCQGLPNVLKLSVGARVILRNNLWTAAGLCNGSMGEVTDIVYKREDRETHLEIQPICLLVRFDKYSGPTVYNGSVPICPISVSFKRRTTNCTRKQFPVNLAYAISIHRSQGITVQKAVIDLGPTEFSISLSYVALSRVKTIDGLLVEPFPLNRLLSINKQSNWPEKRAEMLRLLQLRQ